MEACYIKTTQQWKLCPHQKYHKVHSCHLLLLKCTICLAIQYVCFNLLCSNLCLMVCDHASEENSTDTITAASPWISNRGTKRVDGNSTSEQSSIMTERSLTHWPWYGTYSRDSSATGCHPLQCTPNGPQSPPTKPDHREKKHIRFRNEIHINIAQTTILM